MKKTKLLCVDFEFQAEIYNKIGERNKHIDVTVINRADIALELMSNVEFDILITTIVMPGELDGLNFIDQILESPEKYGDPQIAVLTGLGGDNFHEQIVRRQVDLIDRYERPIKEIEEDIDLFLRYPFEEVDHPYPAEDVASSMADKEMQSRDRLSSMFKYHHPEECSECGSKYFKWIRFISPKESWEMQCGRDAWLLICEDCKKQYEQVINLMS